MVPNFEKYESVIQTDLKQSLKSSSKHFQNKKSKAEPKWGVTIFPLLGVKFCCFPNLVKADFRIGKIKKTLKQKQKQMTLLRFIPVCVHLLPCKPF